MSLLHLEKGDTPTSPWVEQRLASLATLLAIEKEFAAKGQDSLSRIKESWTSNVYPKELRDS